MSLVDVSEVSPALFVIGAIFILGIGSLLSLGVLRLFQLKKRQGIGMFASAAVVFAAFLWIVNTWFV